MRDYSKLRPFDLTKARVEDKVIIGKDLAKIMGTSSWGAAIQFEDGSFGAYHLSSVSHLKQAPLAWLGPDPIYSGDTLWVADENHSHYGRSLQVEGVNVYGLRLSDGSYAVMGRDPDQVCNEKFWSLTQPVARLIEINGHKVPAPESSPPARGTEYYVPALSYIDPLVLYVWDDDQTDHRCLERDLVHLTKEAASAHALALLSFKVDPVKK